VEDNRTDERPATSRSQDRDARSDGSERIVDTQELFGDAREVQIRHNDSVYRLRITRFGKLILNK